MVSALNAVPSVKGAELGAVKRRARHLGLPGIGTLRLVVTSRGDEKIDGETKKG
jgi:hypothetical protein